MEDYKPVLSIWKRDKDGTYWAEHDDIMAAVCDSEYPTERIIRNYGSQRYYETVNGKGIYLFEVRSFEIAIGVYKPLWLRAFEDR